MSIASLLCIALASWASAILTPRAPRAWSQAETDVVARIDRVCEQALAKPGAVGLSVAVARGSQILLAKGYGLVELEHGVRANAQTMFRIGSITKQFTAAAIVLLAEREELWIDADVREYLPELDTKERAVTLRHLLTHTSGIASYTNLQAWRRLTALDLPEEELVGMFMDAPFDFEPGDDYAYCNSGYYLLGMVIERVSGQPFPDFMRSELFEPLGLKRIRRGSNTDLIQNRAQGYRLVKDELENDALIGMSQPGAAGALIASAHDLVLWQIALVGGRVVSEDSYAEMTSPFLLNDLRETSYGFGLTWNQVGGQRCVSHGGGIFGFNSSLEYYVDSAISIAVISNSEDLSSARVAVGIAKIVVPGR